MPANQQQQLVIALVVDDIEEGRRGDYKIDRTVFEVGCAMRRTRHRQCQGMRGRPTIRDQASALLQNDGVDMAAPAVV